MLLWGYLWFYAPEENKEFNLLSHVGRRASGSNCDPGEPTSYLLPRAVLEKGICALPESTRGSVGAGVLPSTASGAPPPSSFLWLGQNRGGPPEPMQGGGLAGLRASGCCPVLPPCAADREGLESGLGLAGDLAVWGSVKMHTCSEIHGKQSIGRCRPATVGKCWGSHCCYLGSKPH